VERILSPSDFFTVKNGWIFEALLELGKSDLPIDFMLLCNRLDERGQLAEIGGAAYISHLINGVVTAIHAEGYALLVKKMAIRREALALASEIAEKAYDQDQVEPMALLDHLVVKAQKIRLEAASRMMRRVSAM
jgi:replicative DNA helicase